MYIGGVARVTEISAVRQDAPYFAGHEPALIYIAKRLSDSLEVEKVLESAGIDYGVEPDTYQGGIVFRTERVGAFFYVLPERAAEAREVLSRAGYRPLKAA